MRPVPLRVARLKPVSNILRLDFITSISQVMPTYQSEICRLKCVSTGGRLPKENDIQWHGISHCGCELQLPMKLQEVGMNDF